MNMKIIFNKLKNHYGVKQRNLVAVLVLYVILRLLWSHLLVGLQVKILVMDQNNLWPRIHLRNNINNKSLLGTYRLYTDEIIGIPPALPCSSNGFSYHYWDLTKKILICGHFLHFIVK